MQGSCRDSAKSASLQATKKYLSAKEVIALFFQCDNLYSPTPLLLFTEGHDRQVHYEKEQYVSLILNVRLGSGAVGDVYKSFIHGMDYRPFITKIATTATRVRRLRHEYTIYMHLHAAKVTGIPLVLGFHENLDAGVSVLLISDVGQPMGMDMDEQRSVQVSDKHGYVSFSGLVVEAHRNRRRALTTILGNIHGAGVLHRDIRSWNMMIDELGEVHIADFDRGSLHGSLSDYAAEKARLEAFIQGRFIDEDAVIGADDLTQAVQ